MKTTGVELCCDERMNGKRVMNKREMIKKELL